MKSNNDIFETLISLVIILGGVFIFIFSDDIKQLIIGTFSCLLLLIAQLAGCTRDKLKDIDKRLKVLENKSNN